MSFTAAIVDSHDVTRWGVRSVVEDVGGTVVDSAQTGPEALFTLEEYKPAVVVLSLDLPKMSGLEILKHLRRRPLASEPVVFTTRNDEESVRQAFDHGVAGYVLKRDSLAVLGTALQRAAQGQRYLSDALPEHWQEGTGENESSYQYHALTERQREVLRLTAEGYTGKEVGEKLSISCRTVEKHREHIRETLGLRSVVEMARYALHRGFFLTAEADWVEQRENGTSLD